MKVCPSCETRFASDAWACPSCSWQAARHGDIPSVMAGEGAPGFCSEFFDTLSQVEDEHFWFTSRTALIAWAVQQYFPGARSFLEVGCGTGHVTAALQRACAGVSFTASEAFLAGLIVASQKAPGVELVHADANDLPWEHEFDVVGAFDVLEHIADDATAVAEMTRAVRPGGGIVVTVPQHEWLWSPLDEYARHERRYTRGRLVEVLEGAGLRVVRVTSFVSLLLPLLIASRVGKRKRPVDPHAEYRLSRAANRAGALVLGLERMLIRLNVSFPAGGSLLAVARRP